MKQHLLLVTAPQKSSMFHVSTGVDALTQVSLSCTFRLLELGFDLHYRRD